MYSSFTWFLALRWLRSYRADSLLATMVVLATISIALGAGALALALAITEGLDTITLRTLQGMSPDLLIRTCSTDDQLVADAIISSIKTNCSDRIVNATGCSIYHALIQKGGESELMSGFTTVHSIDPATFGSVVSIPFTQESVSPLALLREHTIIIGCEAARRLRVRIGDEVVIRYADDGSSDDGMISLGVSRARVVGIFKSGIEEWDAQSAFISRSYADLLFGATTGVDYIGVAVVPGAVDEVCAQLRRGLRLDVRSWKDINPTIMAALRFEQIAIFCIVGLIILIAGATIMALVCMMILYHERSIAILIAHGMSYRALCRTIRLYGILLTVRAAVYGIGFAALIGYCMERYHLIQLPDMYYSTHLPAHMSLTIVAGVLTLAVCTSLCATYYPIRRLRSVSVVDILMR